MIVKESDIKELIKAAEKEDEDTGLNKRWEFDRELIENQEYKMRDSNNEEVSGVLNVTVPEAANYFDKMTSIISEVETLIEILNYDEKMSDDDKKYIIEFIEDAKAGINELLNNEDEWDIMPTQANYLNARGWGAEQILCRIEKGVFIPDVRPIDRAYLKYKSSRKGLEWACPTFRRSKESILKEYDHKISSDYGIVRPFWDDKYQRVYILDTNNKIGESTNIGELVDKKIKNTYGYPPFIIQAVPAGVMLKEADSLKHRGESIFFPHRDMFKEINFVASIAKTQGYDDLWPALQEPGDKTAKAPKKYARSKSVSMVERERKLMPKRDFTNSQRVYSGIVSSITQRAGLSNIDEGGVTQPWSAVAIAKIMAVKQSKIEPRLTALGLLEAARYTMTIAQVIQLNQTVELGTGKMKRKYEPSKLEGAYKIKFNYFTESLEEDATKSSIGNSMAGLLSEKTRRKKYAGIQDNEAEDDQIDREKAEAMVPELQLTQQIHALIDKAEILGPGDEGDQVDNDARMLFKKLIKLLRQQIVEGVAPLQAQQRAKPSQVMPTFGQGGGGSQPGQEVQSGAEG